MTTGHTTPLRMESLESRALLAAVMAPPQTPAAESSQDPIIITEVQVEIDDQPVSVTQRNDILMFKPGQRLEVVGLEYKVADDDGMAAPLDAHLGVLAFEGYLRSGKPEKGGGEFDYRDGRFAAVDQAIETGVFRQNGLEGDAWDLEDGTNRLALALVRYTDQGAIVEDRFHINLQFVETDLAVVSAAVEQKKDEVKFSATVLNQGDKVSTYAEIDVYRAGDFSAPVWVGTYVGDFKSSSLVNIKFTNSNKDDAFEKYWQPTESGSYVFRLYLDPENGLAEKSEANNFLEGRVEVSI